MAIAGGIALSALGVYLGLLDGWNPLIIVGLLGSGFAIGLVVKQFNVNSLL